MIDVVSLPLLSVKKKSGKKEKYSIDKVFQVVLNALNDADAVEAKNFNQATVELANEIVNAINDDVLDLNADVIDVITMQNIIYEQLIEHNEVIAARQYMLYSSKKMQKQEDNSNLLSAINKVFNKDPHTLHENANKNAKTLPTQRDLIISQIFKNLGLKMYPEDVQKAHKKGLIHLHDLDYSPLLPYSNCCNINVEDMLKNGFKVNEISIEEPKSIGTVSTLTAEIIALLSDEQYGGCSIAEVDKLFTPYAKKNYDKHLKEAEKYQINNPKTYAWDLTKKDIYQAMQSLEYNINFNHARGGQTPFTSISFGLATDKIGKEIQKAILNIRIRGLGKDRVTAIFPKLIFFIKDGVNLRDSDPNYDIKQLAIRCSSLRDYPDIMFDKNIKEVTGSKDIPMTPMGCVRGNSVITYRYKGKEYTTSFEKMYEQFKDNEKLQKNGVDKYINLKGVTIKDSHTGEPKFVNCLRIIKNTTPHKWLRISANAGKLFECTDNHPLAIKVKGRVLAKDVKVGDKLITSLPIQSQNNNINNLTVDKAWLLGDIICDGCLNEHSETLISYAFTGEDEIRNKIGTLYNNNFLRDIEQHRGKKGVYKEVAIKDSSLHEECTKSFKGVQKINRVVPDMIFNSNKQIKLSFLAGMIDADGYINKSSQKIQLGSTNKALAYGQYLLMRKLGLKPRIYANHFSKVNLNKIIYRVECIIPKDLVNYLQCNKKKEKIDLDRNLNIKQDSCKITKIESIDLDEPCYDVTTESDYFDVDGLVSHNCRSQLPVWKNSEGKEQVSGRLNMGVVTLNLVHVALESNSIDEFWYNLQKGAGIVHEALKTRINRLRQVKPQEAPLIWQQGGIARLKDNEDITPILKGGRCTASFGYCGLYEVATRFFGPEWEHNKVAYNFTLDVAKYIHQLCQKWYKKEGYWYSEYGTPLEATTDTFCHKDTKQFGKIEYITDKGFYVNSFHYAPWKDVSPFEKLKFEAPFPKQSSGGNIDYVEYESEIRNNLSALETVWDYANEIGIAYLGTNCPISKCLVCNYSGDVKQDSKGFECPRCGNRNPEKLQVVIRVCGYLSSLSERPVVKGRMKEMQSRVHHNMGMLGISEKQDNHVITQDK